MVAAPWAIWAKRSRVPLRAALPLSVSGSGSILIAGIALAWALGATLSLLGSALMILLSPSLRLVLISAALLVRAKLPAALEGLASPSPKPSSYCHDAHRGKVA
jgi:hypothetical protein